MSWVLGARLEIFDPQKLDIIRNNKYPCIHDKAQTKRTRYMSNALIILPKMRRREGVIADIIWSGLKRRLK